MKYYYEPKELKNFLNSQNEIFNIPYSVELFYNGDKSKIFTQIYLNLIKFQIKNELTFEGKKKTGLSEFTLNKIKTNAEYKIEENNFQFHVFDRKEQASVNFKGKFNLKPFYASLDGDLEEINLNYFLGSSTIITQLLKTEIFNNKNIDFKLNISADKIYNTLILETSI